MTEDRNVSTDELQLPHTEHLWELVLPGLKYCKCFILFHSALLIEHYKYYFPKIFIIDIHGAYAEGNPVAIGVSGCRQMCARVGATGSWYNLLLPQWEIRRSRGLRACPSSQRVSGTVEMHNILLPSPVHSQETELYSAQAGPSSSLCTTISLHPQHAMHEHV